MQGEIDGEGGALSKDVCPRRAAGWATGRAILGKIQINIGFWRRNLGSLYILPRAVVTKYQKLKPKRLKTIDISCLRAMEASRSKPRCQQGWFSLRAVKENPSMSLSQLPVTAGDLRRRITPVSPSILTWCSGMSLCLSFLVMRTPVILDKDSP